MLWVNWLKRKSSSFRRKMYWKNWWKKIKLFSFWKLTRKLKWACFCLRNSISMRKRWWLKNFAPKEVMILHRLVQLSTISRKCLSTRMNRMTPENLLGLSLMFWKLWKSLRKNMRFLPKLLKVKGEGMMKFKLWKENFISLEKFN